MTKAQALGAVSSFDVRGWGAVGDGTTDDTTALQAAMAALIASGGGRLYFPKGTYLTSAAIEATAGSVEVFGDGDASIIKLKAGSNLTLNRLLYFNGCSYASAHDLRFDGNKANNSGGTSQGLCEAADSGVVKFYAMTAVDSDTDGFHVRGVQSAYVQGCHAENCSLTGTKITDATYSRAVNNTYKNCQRSIGIENSDCADIAVIGNTIYGDGGSVQVNGITVATDYTDLETATRIVIHGNVIRSCGTGHSAGAGIAISGDQTAIAVGDVSIVGNIISNCRDGVTVSRTTGVTVSGNIIRNSDIRGVSISGGRDIAITGNGIFNHDTHATESKAIAIAANATPITINSDSIVVTGNVLRNDTSVNSPVGVAVSNSSQTGIVVANNAIHGFTTAVSNFTGTEGILRGNAGFATEAKGTATVASGQTTIAVTHGLDYTPSAGEIVLTPAEQGDNDYGRVWVSTIGATQFTINVSANPGASGLDVGWSVRKV